MRYRHVWVVQLAVFDVAAIFGALRLTLVSRWVLNFFLIIIARCRSSIVLLYFLQQRFSEFSKRLGAVASLPLTAVYRGENRLYAPSC